MASSRPKSICAIYHEKDKSSGETISNFLYSKLGEKVFHADLNNSAVLDSPNYFGYFAVMSKESCQDDTFMMLLFLNMTHLYKNKEATFVPVIVDEGIKSEDQNETCLKTQGLPGYLPINMIPEPVVITGPDLDDKCLSRIEAILQGPSPYNAPSLPIGNVGIGLAYNYFKGYLVHILPDIADRIMLHGPGNMTRKFFIFVPQSGKLAAKFSDIDPRFSTLEEPLEGSITKTRAGKNRTYKSYVHEIKRNQDSYYFCGEFATPVRSLREMRRSEYLLEDQLNEQVAVFIHTLRALIQSHPRCRNNALVVSYDDRKAGFSLVDELCKLIEQKREEWATVQDHQPPVLQWSNVHIVHGKDGEILAGNLKEDFEKYTGFAVRCHSSLENLAAEVANAKLFIILTEEFKNQVEKAFDTLIPHWFPRATFIVDMQSEIPEWLEKFGADYIDMPKLGYEISWKTIFSSLFVPRQLNLPIVDVAEGLAWGYYYNYLKVIGPKLAASKELAEMQTKLVILVPHSGHSQELEVDENKVEHVVGTANEEIAGNKREYSIVLYKIPRTDYWTCVEYCNPIQVLYEMEAERPRGLSPRQKDVERKQFCVELKKILERHGAPGFCRNIKLIEYDDSPRKLSDVVLDKIRESL